MEISVDMFKALDESEKKQKIYIVEGPDGSGKTTVAKVLSLVHNFPAFHLSFIDDKDAMEKQFERVYSFLYSLPCNKRIDGCIFDRFVLSNVIYSDVFKNGEVSKEALKINGFLTAYSRLFDITFVNCLPSDKERYLEEFKKLSESREELFSGDVARIGLVYDAYKLEFSRQVDNLARIDKNIKHVLIDRFNDGINTIEAKKLIEI